MNKSKHKFFYKISASRGYGDKMFELVREQNTELVLKNNKGEEFTIYKAHCYRDRECVFAGFNANVNKK